MRARIYWIFCNRRPDNWSIKRLLLIKTRGTSLVVQWLELQVSTAEGVGSVPGQENYDPTGPGVRLKKKGKKPKNQISQVKEFSAFLCIERCKRLDSLKSFL